MLEKEKGALNIIDAVTSCDGWNEMEPDCTSSGWRSDDMSGMVRRSTKEVIAQTHHELKHSRQHEVESC